MMRALGACLIVAATAAETAPTRADGLRHAELQDCLSLVQAQVERHETSRRDYPEGDFDITSWGFTAPNTNMGPSKNIVGGNASGNITFKPKPPPVYAPDYNYSSQPESRFLVFPEKKLAFCYIEKNACTQFNQLFNRLNKISGFPQNKPWMEYYKSNLNEQNMTMADISQKNGWKWGVFLRNPVDRYISAWGSKCVQQEDEGRHCLPVGMFAPKGSTDDLLHNLEANLKNLSGLLTDPHWAPQSAFCGGLNGTRGFDFVGSLSGDVNKQVKDMLKMADVETSWVDTFFPPNDIAGHKAPKKKFPPDASKKVRELYSEDFRLPVPTDME